MTFSAVASGAGYAVQRADGKQFALDASSNPMWATPAPGVGVQTFSQDNAAAAVYGLNTPGTPPYVRNQVGTTGQYLLQYDDTRVWTMQSQGVGYYTWYDTLPVPPWQYWSCGDAVSRQIAWMLNNPDA